MKRVTVLSSILLFCCANLVAQPLATYNNNYYKDGKFVEQHMGKKVALEGVISQIKEGPHDRPIIALNLTDNAKEELWVGSITKNKALIKIGDKVRVMGFFDETAMETEYMSKITQDKEYLLGFCFYDIDTQATMYTPKWMKECMAWEKDTMTEKLSQ